MTPRCQLLSHRLLVREALGRPPPSALRKYTTSDSVPRVVKNPLRRRKGGDLGTHNVKDIIPEGATIPKYPYGDHQLFKRSNKGLYGEQKIEFGNNVSAKTETRTRRSWSLNTFNKGLYSVALKKKIMLRVTSKVLKIIDREGGLDEYLLKDSEKRIKELGPFGWKLRWVLMQKPEIQDRNRIKAEALGIDQEVIDSQWPTHEVLSERGVPKAIKKAREQAPELEHEGNTGLPGFADLSVQDISGPFPESVHEYRRASKAAIRYVRRKFVEDVDSGLVLAFLRAKERTEISERNLSQYEHKMNTIDDAYLEEMKARMNIDYTSRKRLQRLAFLEQKHAKIEEAGGLEAWNIANKPNTPRPTLEEKKAQYAQVIADARAELSDPKTSDDRRAWLEKAFLKAELAIKARASQPELGGGSREYTNMLAALKDDKTGGKVRWADIVASTKISALKGSKTLST